MIEALRIFEIHCRVAWLAPFSVGMNVVVSRWILFLIVGILACAARDEKYYMPSEEKARRIEALLQEDQPALRTFLIGFPETRWTYFAHAEGQPFILSYNVKVGKRYTLNLLYHVTFRGRYEAVKSAELMAFSASDLELWKSVQARHPSDVVVLPTFSLSMGHDFGGLLADPEAFLEARFIPLWEKEKAEIAKRILRQKAKGSN